MSSSFPQLKVGILGGGQLSRMLVEAALDPELDLQPVVYSASSQSPAALVAPEHIEGTMQDENQLKRFFKGIDVCIFENEFLDCRKLEELAESLGSKSKLRFAPGLRVIERLQDKLNQKKIFETSALPSTRYEVWNGSDLKGWTTGLATRFKNGVVLKWSRMGYDGKGVLIVSDLAAKTKEIEKFCSEALSKGAQVYAEEKVSFQRELAIVACHSTTGEFASYPLVISEQTNGICKRVVGPASQFGVAAELMSEARHCAEVIARATGIVGTFAIEFFEDENGRLLINEVAPRVHNTGHYTQDASATSQFANHWRAVLGRPLGRTDSHEVFAMFNLLGPEGVSLDLDPPLLPKVSENISLHWYFKPEIRSRRKLGHLNASASDPNEFPNRLRELERIDLQWQESLRNLQK